MDCDEEIQAYPIAIALIQRIHIRGRLALLIVLRRHIEKVFRDLHELTAVGHFEGPVISMRGLARLFLVGFRLQCGSVRYARKDERCTQI